MTAAGSSTSRRVLIVGGGVAGLEALLALRALAGDRVTLTVVPKDDRFVDRPMTVAEPFRSGAVARHSLAEIAAECGAEFIHATVAAVDASERRITCAPGPELGFDTLILAPGARASAPVSDAITVGVEGSGLAVKEMLGRLRSGEARSVAFVAPRMTGWLLPLYELALMTAHHLVLSEVERVGLRLVTPEDRPLELFGEAGSTTVGRLLDAAGIEFVGATSAPVGAGEVPPQPTAESLAVDYVVTLPHLRGPGLAGVPAEQPDDFVPVDGYGRVRGLDDVYAAGDAVDFPVKQGGLAAQQADTVAEHIASRYGAHVRATPFRPALRGMLFTGGQPHFLRAAVPGADQEIADAWYPLWWPPTKVAGRYLAPYLFERGDGEVFGAHPEGFMDIDIPLSVATLPG
jgi:sulfide:quinone oxidoreductase